MSRRFPVALGVLALAAVLIVVGLIIESDRVSDFLFSLPSWVVVGVIVAYPLICLCVVALCTAGGRADELADRALEHRAAETWSRPENVRELPRQEPAKVIQFPTRDGTRA